jgi:hypothetical protein
MRSCFRRSMTSAHLGSFGSMVGMPLRGLLMSTSYPEVLSKNDG